MSWSQPCREHYGKYEPALTALKRKHEAAMREKALTALERDRLREQVAALKAAAASAGTGGGGGSGSGSGSGTTGGLNKGPVKTGAEEEAEQDTIKGTRSTVLFC